MLQIFRLSTRFECDIYPLYHVSMAQITIFVANILPSPPVFSCKGRAASNWLAFPRDSAPPIQCEEFLKRLSNRAYKFQSCPSFLALFPGSAQLSVTCSMAWGEPGNEGYQLIATNYFSRIAIHYGDNDEPLISLTCGLNLMMLVQSWAILELLCISRYLPTYHDIVTKLLLHFNIVAVPGQSAHNTCKMEVKSPVYLCK